MGNGVEERKKKKEHANTVRGRERERDVGECRISSGGGDVRVGNV